MEEEISVEAENGAEKTNTYAAIRMYKKQTERLQTLANNKDE